ncbi:MAG: PH domain-containing protein [Bacillota bacterium]
MGRYEELLGKAKKILAPDEEFIESIYGSYDFDSDSIISSKWGPLIITNKRIIIVKENTFDIISISFEKISQIITDKNIDGKKS